MRARRKERPFIENVGALEDGCIVFLSPLFFFLLFEGSQEELSQIHFIT